MEFMPYDTCFFFGYAQPEIIDSLQGRFACHQTSAPVFGLLPGTCRSSEATALRLPILFSKICSFNKFNISCLFLFVNTLFILIFICP